MQVTTRATKYLVGTLVGTLVGPNHPDRVPQLRFLHASECLHESCGLSCARDELNQLFESEVYPCRILIVRG